MKKSILMAIVMGVALAGYGYLATKAGHDHSNHENNAVNIDRHDDGHQY